MPKGDQPALLSCTLTRTIIQRAARQLYLGIYVGTQSVKALLYDAERLRVSGARKSQRYASFDAGEGARSENGDLDLGALRDLAAESGEPEHRSGKQEWYENVINQYL